VLAGVIPSSCCFAERQHGDGDAEAPAQKHFTSEELEAEVRRFEEDVRPKPVQGAAGVKRKQQKDYLLSSSHACNFALIR
jgi:hypothetical protein